MALPTIAVAQAAVTSIYSVFANRPERPRNRSAVATLNELLTAIVEGFGSDADVTITEGGELIAAAFLSTGEVGIALGGRDAVAGDIFTSLGTGDFLTATDLDTAKGSTPAAGDRWEVLSAATVAYLGGATEVEMDDEQVIDFMAVDFTKDTEGNTY